MARGHPDQVRLTAFLDHAAAVVEDVPLAAKEGLALRLDVGLPPTVELLKHHDLDNYLFPLITRLGPRKFATAWATKATTSTSAIRVDQARVVDAIDQAPYQVRTTRSAETVAWKAEVRDQLIHAKDLPDGPLELQLSFRVGPNRNWANLWKPTIDSLDPILGSDGGRSWNPRDGRIVRLGLHHEVA